MSLGLQFIRACLRDNNTSKLREAKSQLFIEDDEQNTLTFVRTHLSNYGSLPDKQVVEQAGVAMATSAKQPPQFYLDRLRKRFIYVQINSQMPTFRSAMESEDVETAVTALRAMISGANEQLAPNSFSTFDALAQDVQHDYEFAKNHPGLRGITLGWPTLDLHTLGAQGGDLIVVAGRTGMGKSWVLSKMAYEAWLSGHSLLFVSMEMSLVPIARRFVGLHSAINPNYIRAGQLSQMAEQKLVESVNDITSTGANAYFLSGDFKKEVSAIEDMVNEFDCEIIYIDAAYLLSASARKAGSVSRWEQIASVVQELKQLALKTNKPIVISVQMNRNVKKRTTKTLDTGDVAGSDSIPQDASILFGLRQGPPPFEKTRRIGELIKNREGEEVRIDMNFKFAPVDLSEAPTTDEVNENDVNYML
jgi:replicative DNA helicase